VAGTPGMDADPVGRDKVEDARPTDLDGEAGGTAELTGQGAAWAAQSIEDIGAAPPTLSRR
jgi:hypothetical protein